MPSHVIVLISVRATRFLFQRDICEKLAPIDDQHQKKMTSTILRKTIWFMTLTTTATFSPQVSVSLNSRFNSSFAGTVQQQLFQDQPQEQNPSMTPTSCSTRQLFCTIGILQQVFWIYGVQHPEWEDLQSATTKMDHNSSAQWTSAATWRRATTSCAELSTTSSIKDMDSILSSKHRDGRGEQQPPSKSTTKDHMHNNPADVITSMTEGECTQRTQRREIRTINHLWGESDNT